MADIPNHITTNFIAAVDALKSTGKIAKDIDLIEVLDLKQSTISLILSGKRNIPLPKAKIFSEHYKVDIFGNTPSLNGSKEKILEDLKQALRDLEDVKTDVALLKKIVLKQE